VTTVLLHSYLSVLFLIGQKAFYKKNLFKNEFVLKHFSGIFATAYIIKPRGY